MPIVLSFFTQYLNRPTRMNTYSYYLRSRNADHHVVCAEVRLHVAFAPPQTLLLQLGIEIKVCNY